MGLSGGFLSTTGYLIYVLRKRTAWRGVHAAASVYKPAPASPEGLLTLPAENFQDFA
jgi:hypothetical protein